MSSHVLLNLLNKLGEIRHETLPRILSIFPNEFDNTGVRM